MYVRFKANYNGSIWMAEAEGLEIYAIGSSFVTLMGNVEKAANEYFDGFLPDGEEIHIVVVNESSPVLSGPLPLPLRSPIAPGSSVK